MVLIYRVFGLLYVLSGLWCAISSELAAGFLGLAFADVSGQAEFFSVYGGLQLGLGLAMLISSWRADYLEGSLFFAMIFSGCLAGFRVLSFILFGVIEQFMVMLILELLIVIGLFLVWARIRRPT